nr:hypothetical protein [Tanacetum cinerariifolium]
MAILSEDIHCAGKDNGANILKSIDEGPFKMGKFRETLEGALHLGLERDRVFADLTPEEKEMVDRTEVGRIRLGEQLQLGIGVFRTKWAMQILVKQGRLSVITENGAVLDAEQLLFITSAHTAMFDDDVDEAPVQDFALNEDNIFQVDQCDAFDSNVNEVLTTQTMFMVNLSSTDPIYDEAGPSYDSDFLFEGLTKVFTEMQEIYEQMEAEVDQNAMDKKSAKIKRKNLLIENENLIVDCLSKEVFYTATNYVLTKIRIEQYFLMTDYSLWEVILNGDSLIPTKARGTLLMALPDKHQLKFNIHKDAKSLMEAIEKRFGRNKEIKKVHKTLLKQQYENFTDSSSKSLDRIHDSLHKLISQLEILGELLSQEDINMKFLRSLPSKWRTHTLIWRNKADLEDQSLDDLFNNLKIYEAEMAMLTMRARRFLQRTRRNLRANGTTSIGFDMSKVECYNYHMRWHFARECRYDWSFQADEEPKNYALMAFTSSSSLGSNSENETVFEEDIKLLKLDVMLRDNALVELRNKFEKAEQERDELKLKLENFQTSLKNLSKLLASQITDKTRLGYDNQVFINTVFDCDELISSELDSNRHSALIIEDWVSDLEYESEGEPMPTQKAPSFVQYFEHVKTPRLSVKPVKHPTLAKNLRKDIPKSRGHRHSWNRKACFVRKSINHLIKDCDYYKKKMHALKDKGVIDSGCSRHMTGNISYLSDFKEINAGYVAFGGNPKGGTITGKGKIRTGKLDFDDVYFVKELKSNLFSISQMCDKKNNVLFIDIECLVLSFDFKLPDENYVLFRVLRENNMYNVYLKNIVSLGDLTCLFAKATLDESNLWHRRLGHINFKTMNKLVKENLVRGLPSKVFENNHTCDACKKGKQHRASCKTKPISFVSEPLQRLPMDLFGPTFVKSLNKKSYCLVVTDDYSRMKGVKREFSVTRTHQHNRIAKRKNMTLIKAARSMLADSLLPIPFWAEAYNTACYVQNRVLVTKHDNKTPYELLLGRIPSIGFIRPFGCPVTIFNTLDPLGKFDGKDDEGFFIGYSISRKRFRVFNSRTRIVLETLHEELLQFKMQKVWVLVDLPKGKRAIGSKWVFRNKKDERGIVIRNKARLVIQGHTQKEGIDYKEVFAPVARIEAIRLFLAYASFMGFMVYQMDVKSAFLYGTIKGEMYACQPLGFENPDYPDKVYKVVKSLYGLHQAPRACQDKYVAKILRKFDLTDGKLASASIDTKKPLLKDPDVKRIFRYLKGKPRLGLRYLKDLPFSLVAYSDSDYAGASLDKKSTTGGCQFLGCRLISWQCKKKTVIATSSTKAEYVAVASYYAQVLWTQNQIFNAVSSKLLLLGLTIHAAHLILLGHKYALKVNPTIYVSCVKQFFTSISIKNANDVVRLQVLIDRKKVIITEDTIRQALRLDDADSVDSQDVEDAAEDEDNVNKVSAEPTPSSPTPATPPPPPQQDHIPSPPQAETAQPSSLPQKPPL